MLLPTARSAGGAPGSIRNRQRPSSRRAPGSCPMCCVAGTYATSIRTGGSWSRVTAADADRTATSAGRPPRVSVVLPVHKSEAYLAAAVESILAQSFGDWELLAIDDGLSNKSS